MAPCTHEVKSRGLVCPIGISILGCPYQYVTREINGLEDDINNILMETNVFPRKPSFFYEVSALLI